MWNRPASASASKSGRGSWRIRSVSSAYCRTSGASSRATSSIDRTPVSAVLMGLAPIGKRLFGEAIVYVGWIIAGDDPGTGDGCWVVGPGYWVVGVRELT